MEVDADLQALPSVNHLVYTIQKSQKMGALQTLLDQRDGEAVIVFGRTKHGVKKAGEPTRCAGISRGGASRESQPSRPGERDG